MIIEEHFWSPGHLQLQDHIYCFRSEQNCSVLPDARVPGWLSHRLEVGSGSDMAQKCSAAIQPCSETITSAIISKFNNHANWDRLLCPAARRPSQHYCSPCRFRRAQQTEGQSCLNFFISLKLCDNFFLIFCNFFPPMLSMGKYTHRKTYTFAVQTFFQ